MFKRGGFASYTKTGRKIAMGRALGQGLAFNPFMEQIFEGVSWDGTARTHLADFNGDGLGDLLVLQSVWTSATSQAVTPIVFLNKMAFR